MKNSIQISTTLRRIIFSGLFIALSGLESLNAQRQLCLSVGSSDGNSDGYSMVGTADSGYVIAGQTNAFGAGGYDVYVVKLSKAGAIEWTRTVGGSGDDYGRSIVKTFDGGYAVAGWTDSYGQGGSDFYIIKLDSTGTVQWTRTVGGTGTDEAWAIIQTTDSGYAIAGQTSSFGASPTDMYLVKLDASGNLLWDRRIQASSTGANTASQAYSLVQTPDGGYALCGTTYTYTGNIATSANNFYVVKVNGTGALVWTFVLLAPDPSVNGFDYANSIINTADGGLMVVGNAEQAHSSGGLDWHYLALKLTASGTMQWTRFTGGLDIAGVSDDNSDYPQSVIQTADGGYVIGGWSFSFNYNFTTSTDVGLELFIVKLDSSGNYLWSKVVGTPSNDIGEAIIQTPDGGFAMAGYMQPLSGSTPPDQVEFVKLDSSVSACCTRTIGGDRGTGGTPGTSGTSIVAAGVASTGGTSGSGGTVNDLGTCGSVAPLPVAAFQSNDTIICANDCINFTNLSTNATSWQWSFAGALDSTSTAQNPQNVCYSKVGIYDVTLIASNSTGSDTIKVTNFINVSQSPPSPTITRSNDTLYCSFDTSYASYQWYADSAIVEGATKSYYVVSQSGNYNVQVTNKNHCEIAAGINLVLGIEEFSRSISGLRFTVSPNPVSDELLIDGNWKMEDGSLKLAIINILGQTIYTEEPNSKPLTVNCKPFSSGIYFAKVSNETGTWIGKFIKE